MQKFYAVTQTSVYRVTRKRGENGWPIVLKVEKKVDAHTTEVGTVLRGGLYVGITCHSAGILLYDSSKLRDGNNLPQYPEEINTIHHGGKTSQLVALFKDMRGARKCLMAKRPLPWDERFAHATTEVLRAIGPSDSMWVVSLWAPDKSLPEVCRFYDILMAAGWPSSMR